ncbi:MAG TPA: hypothetical protein PKE64_12455 [Anaerolineae bacterium]|nr:hypothetical protein [Anaerolineae bacterium]HMR64811.1 hypothetical protein [Anaerolineae bacterium]
MLSVSRPLSQQIEILLGQNNLPEEPLLDSEDDRDDAVLKAGQVMLEAWRMHIYRAQALLAAQQKMSEAEAGLRETLLKEVTSLRETVYTLFNDEPILLASLGIRPRRKAGVFVKQASYDLTTAETIVRWRVLFNNALQLSSGKKNLLVKAGWTDERLIEAANLVEIYAEASNGQQAQIHAFRVEQAAANAVESLLQRWHEQMLRRPKPGVNRSAPAYREKVAGPTVI